MGMMGELLALDALNEFLGVFSHPRPPIIALGWGTMGD